jgi:hypothetical protein
MTIVPMGFLGSSPSESDSSLDYEQALSPLEYRSDAASAAECAGLRTQGPRLAVYRWAGAGEPSHGFATLGIIGFEGRFDYAAIGTVSNVASRLCDEAKPGLF